MIEEAMKLLLLEEEERLAKEQKDKERERSK